MDVCIYWLIKIAKAQLLGNQSFGKHCQNLFYVSCTSVFYVQTNHKLRSLICSPQRQTHTVTHLAIFNFIVLKMHVQPKNSHKIV